MFEFFLYNILVFFVILIITNIIHSSVFAAALEETTNDEASQFMANVLKLDGSGTDTIFNKIRNIALKTTQVVLGPVYKILESMMENIKVINDAIQSGRHLINQVRGSASLSFQSIINLIYNVVADIQSKMIRIQILTKRIFASFIAIFYATNSGIKMGESFGNSVFFKVLNFFCLEKNTKIQLDDDTWIPIYKTKPGMKTKHDGEILSVIKVKKNECIDTYKIGNIIMSGEHYVYDNQLSIWLPAKLHPDASLVKTNTTELYTLETTKGTITLWNEETNEPLFTKDYNDEGILNTMIYGKMENHSYHPYSSYNKIKNTVSSHKEVVITIYNKQGFKMLIYDTLENTFHWSNGENTEYPILSDIDKIVSHNIFRLSY